DIADVDGLWRRLRSHPDIAKEDCTYVGGDGGISGLAGDGDVHRGSEVRVVVGDGEVGSVVALELRCVVDGQVDCALAGGAEHDGAAGRIDQDEFIGVGAVDDKAVLGNRDGAAAGVADVDHDGIGHTDLAAAAIDGVWRDGQLGSDAVAGER